MTTAKIIPLPVSPQSDERKLLAAWAKLDRMKADLRAQEAETRLLERKVARARGYGDFIRREALQMVMGGEE